MTFCWIASHACRFEGAAAVVEADAEALVAADIGGDMPAVNEEEAGAIGSRAIDASLCGGVSLGLVHASGRIAMAARTLFNRAP